MLHWICPECGRECQPEEYDCPKCHPVAVAVGITEAHANGQIGNGPSGYAGANTWQLNLSVEELQELPTMEIPVPDALSLLSKRMVPIEPSKLAPLTELTGIKEPAGEVKDPEAEGPIQPKAEDHVSLPEQELELKTPDFAEQGLFGLRFELGVMDWNPGINSPGAAFMVEVTDLVGETSPNQLMPMNRALPVYRFRPSIAILDPSDCISLPKPAVEDNQHIESALAGINFDAQKPPIPQPMFFGPDDEGYWELAERQLDMAAEMEAAEKRNEEQRNEEAAQASPSTAEVAAEAPAIAEAGEPIVESPAPAAEAPAVAEAPIVAEAPVVPEASSVSEAPVVAPAPAAEVEPVAEVAPAIDPAPAAEAPVPEPAATEPAVAELPVPELPATESVAAQTPAAEAPVIETPVTETPAAEPPIAEPIAPVAQTITPAPAQPSPSVDDLARELFDFPAPTPKLPEASLKPDQLVLDMNATQAINMSEIWRRAAEQYAPKPVEPVAATPASAVEAMAPVAQPPVVQQEEPVAEAVAPVAEAVAPVTEAVAPPAEAVAPVAEVATEPAAEPAAEPQPITPIVESPIPAFQGFVKRQFVLTPAESPAQRLIVPIVGGFAPGQPALSQSIRKSETKPIAILPQATPKKGGAMKYVIGAGLALALGFGAMTLLNSGGNNASPQDPPAGTPAAAEPGTKTTNSKRKAGAATQAIYRSNNIEVSRVTVSIKDDLPVASLVVKNISDEPVSNVRMNIMLHSANASIYEPALGAAIVRVPRLNADQAQRINVVVDVAAERNLPPADKIRADVQIIEQ